MDYLIDISLLTDNYSIGKNTKVDIRTQGSSDTTNTGQNTIQEHRTSTAEFVNQNAGQRSWKKDKGFDKSVCQNEFFFHFI